MAVILSFGDKEWEPNWGSNSLEPNRQSCHPSEWREASSRSGKSGSQGGVVAIGYDLIYWGLDFPVQVKSNQPLIFLHVRATGPVSSSEIFPYRLIPYGVIC